jgi:hypothetical protein
VIEAGSQADGRQDYDVFVGLREAIRRRRVRLTFISEPIAYLFQALYWSPKTGAIVFIMFAPLLYLFLGFAVLFLLAVVAQLIPSIAPIMDFLSGKPVAGLVVGLFVVVYWIWRRRVALSSVEAWKLLWRAGVLSVATKDRSIRCESPECDWRAFAKSLGPT